ATYRGISDLRHWLRVAALRAAVDLLRTKNEEPIEPERLLAHPDPGEDPELDYIKRVYRAEFNQAFQRVFADLSFRERNLIRYVIRDRLDSDAMAAIYRVSRATVNRWLQSVREKLLTGVRTMLRERLNVNTRELESILALIQSRLEVTLGD